MKLFEAYGKSIPPQLEYKLGNILKSTVRYGVEVELENVRDSYNFQSKYWELVGDGSLRDNGGEFRFSSPLFGMDVELALEYLANWIDTIIPKPKTSVRCSTHIHMDASTFDLVHLKNFFIVFLCIEKVLYNSLHPSRVNNLYCPPLHSLHTTAKRIHGIKDDNIFELRDNLNSPKYVGVNTGAIDYKGSIEFRMFHGTTWPHEILIWILLLDHLYHYSKELDEGFIFELPSYVSEKGHKRYLEELFPEGLITFNSGTLSQDLMYGVRMAQYVINFSDVAAMGDMLNRTADKDTTNFDSLKENI